MISQIARNYRELTKRVMADEHYKTNIEFQYDWPQSGHPEGKVKYHIAELEANLERLKPLIPNEAFYWKLKFLIHVHDTFKAKASREGVPADHPDSHESLARIFASEFTDDTDLLNIIQYHDENYTLWKQFKKNGSYDSKWLEHLLDTIHDWDLFLAFTIIDGYTQGKDIEKLPWFIAQVRQHKQTLVNEDWITALSIEK